MDEGALQCRGPAEPRAAAALMLAPGTSGLVVRTMPPGAVPTQQAQDLQATLAALLVAGYDGCGPGQQPQQGVGTVMQD